MAESSQQVVASGDGWSVTRSEFGYTVDIRGEDFFEANITDFVAVYEVGQPYVRERIEAKALGDEMKARIAEVFEASWG